jgi:23S rRNA (uridine2552-2'-O)-methyltransferase
LARGRALFREDDGDFILLVRAGKMGYFYQLVPKASLQVVFKIPLTGQHPVKEVQDYYFKKAKKEGYPARSVYKLEEVQKKYGLLQSGNKILDLGCQPGSWSMYAARIAGPGGLVVGVDRNRGKTITSPGGARIVTLCGDIMEDAVVDLITSECLLFDVIISDIAPRTSGNKWADQQLSLRLSRRVLQLTGSLLRPGGNFYCKVFEGEDFRDLFAEAKGLFQRAKVFKPKSSRKESREVFILGLVKKESLEFGVGS